MAPAYPTTTGVQAILAAATDLFAQSSYEAVSVSAIAERAKVSKANVFHPFDSKHALYVQVLQSACGRHAQFAEKLLGEDGSVAEKICRLMIFSLEDMLFAQHESKLVVGEFMAGCIPRGGLISGEVVGRKLDLISELIRQGQRAGEFRPDIDAKLLAVLIDSALVYYFKARYMLDTCAQFEYAHQPATYAREACRILLLGVSQPVTAESKAP